MTANRPVEAGPPARVAMRFVLLLEAQGFGKRSIPRRLVLIPFRMDDNPRKVPVGVNIE
jgi:hypothetical protein